MRLEGGTEFRIAAHVEDLISFGGTSSIFTMATPEEKRIVALFSLMADDLGILEDGAVRQGDVIGVGEGTHKEKSGEG